MRIVIDLQGAQSSGSWNRGIGRYTMSLTSSMVRNGGEHEFYIILNGAFPESVDRIRTKFSGLLPKQNIHIWNAPLPMAQMEARNDWRRQTGELLREAFLASFNPDIVLVSSLFEGFSDDAVTSIKKLPTDFVTAVILYDLIPFIHREPYLENPLTKSWYLEKIEYLQKADLWLAISDSSKQEGIEHLRIPAARNVNVSTDADLHFQKITISTEAENEIRVKYGLSHSFVMYTGGIDHRKNIEGLIRAYAKLPPELRRCHQLAIVCSAQQNSRDRLLLLAGQYGLDVDELILTGFVPEEDLVALYNLCAVFVFASWHEGFGLPALEAMRCGAPVIASNVSSLPEVVGMAEALFDPHSDDDICRAIERVLTDDAFRERLVAHGIVQAQKFSWDESARRAIDAMESIVNEYRPDRTLHVKQATRPKLAFVSPLPPERSGISDYSAELLPQLTQYYDIEVVVAQECVADAWINANCPIRSVPWFKKNASRFDRVLYHFGNSVFHQHMFELLQAIPGIVVLHDFYLSGVLHHMEATQYIPGCFSEQLQRSHGQAGLLDRNQTNDVAKVILKYPCSRDVIEDSLGTIVHADNSTRLAQRWYAHAPETFSVIPLLRAPVIEIDRNDARKELGLAEQDFVVCSFGILAPSKLNHRLLNAWFDSALTKSGNCHLIFVGENHTDDYGRGLLASIKGHANNSSIQITGWVDRKKFHLYLAAADLGVQLRSLSRGETSAAVLDCMNYGLATIINANGSMADLSDDTVWKLPDHFDNHELIYALETLWRNSEIRHQIGNKAKKVILEKHNPAHCAKQYATAIENFYAKNRPMTQTLVRLIAELPIKPECDQELISLASSIASNSLAAKTQ